MSDSRVNSALIEFCRRVVDAAADPRLLEIKGALHFPNGMCTWMSFAGGELLRHGGFGVWEIQNAEWLDEPLFHDWVVQGDLYVDFTAHQFARFDAHRVGVGANPVTELFLILRGRYPTQSISSHAHILEYNERLSEIWGTRSLGRLVCLNGPRGDEPARHHGPSHVPAVWTPHVFTVLAARPNIPLV